MKNIILSVLGLCITSVAFTQNNFQGKIVLKLALSNKPEKNDTLEVYYGPQKIKGLQKGSSKKKEDLLVDFTSGVAYTINNTDKTYKADSLEDKKLPDMILASAENKKVFGYDCSAYSVNPGDTAQISLDSKMIFWYADSLYYAIPPQYINGEILAIFTNGRNVGMGMSMGIKLGEMTMSIEASVVSIEEKIIPASFFELPADYSLAADEEQLDFSNLEMKTEMPDTLVAVPAPKKAVKKTPRKQTPAKKAPVKSSAAARKQ